MRLVTARNARAAIDAVNGSPTQETVSPIMRNEWHRFEETAHDDALF